MNVLRALRKRITGSRVEADSGVAALRRCRDAVAMFHTGRSGSTVVARMLNQHSEICWPGELFENVPERYGDAPRANLVERVLGEWSERCLERNKHVLGFETKYLPHQHLRKTFLDTTLEDYLSLLHGLRKWKFVVVQRENYLRRAISAQVGARTKTWHAKEAGGGPVRIALDLHNFRTGEHREPLLELFRTLDENYEKLRQLLRHEKTLYLSYERDILDDPTVAYGAVCDFLQVNRESPSIDLVRTNPFPYEAMLTNFAEVTELLKGTKYEWMLSSR